MKDIYVLVAFSFSYVAAQKENAAIERKYKHTVKNSRFNLPKDVLDKKLANLIHSPTNRGFFSTKEIAIENIEKYPESIHEMGYYSYLLIERKPLDSVDGFYFKNSETWFKLNEKTWKYERCKRPSFAKGTICFS